MADLANLVSNTEMRIKGGKQDCTMSKHGVCIREICTAGSAASNMQYFGGHCRVQGNVCRNMSHRGSCAGNWEYECLMIPSHHQVGYCFCRNSHTIWELLEKNSRGCVCRSLARRTRFLDIPWMVR